LLKGVGVDLVSIRRIEKIINRYPERFLKRVFSPAELKYCFGNKASSASLAARFAAKEAVLKAIGCGIGPAGLAEVEIISGGDQQPQVELHGEAYRLACERGISGFSVSITHEPPFACAIAVVY
jgi:holo-[acyl-carrier protein] synthase